MTKILDIKKHLSNPFLWFAVVTFFVAIVTGWNQIGTNTTYIETVEARLKKKIEILSDLEARTLEIEMEMISRNEKIKDLRGLEAEFIKVQIDLATTKKEVEVLNEKLNQLR